MPPPACKCMHKGQRAQRTCETTSLALCKHSWACLARYGRTCNRFFKGEPIRLQRAECRTQRIAVLKARRQQRCGASPIDCSDILEEPSASRVSKLLAIPISDRPCACTCACRLAQHGAVLASQPVTTCECRQSLLTGFAQASCRGRPRRCRPEAGRGRTGTSARSNRFL